MGMGMRMGVGSEEAIRSRDGSYLVKVSGGG